MRRPSSPPRAPPLPATPLFCVAVVVRGWRGDVFCDCLMGLRSADTGDCGTSVPSRVGLFAAAGSPSGMKLFFIITGNRPAARAAFPSVCIHRLSLTRSTKVASLTPPIISHFLQRSPKKSVPRKGEREGEICELRNSESFPPRKFPRETIPGVPKLSATFPL